MIYKMFMLQNTKPDQWGSQLVYLGHDMLERFGAFAELRTGISDDAALAEFAEHFPDVPIVPDGRAGMARMFGYGYPEGHKWVQQEPSPESANDATSQPSPRRSSKQPGATSGRSRTKDSASSKSPDASSTKKRAARPVSAKVRTSGSSAGSAPEFTKPSTTTTPTTTTTRPYTPRLFEK